MSVLTLKVTGVRDDDSAGLLESVERGGHGCCSRCCGVRGQRRVVYKVSEVMSVPPPAQSAGRLGKRAMIRAAVGRQVTSFPGIPAGSLTTTVDIRGRGIKELTMLNLIHKCRMARDRHYD